VTRDYREDLFNSYDRHTSALDESNEAKLAWFSVYVGRYYLPHFARLGPDAEILEIGCNRGYLLATLSAAGYRRLHGIDLSPVDVDEARVIVPDANLECVAAADFLTRRPGAFDAILMKAVLEHVPKADTLPLLDAVASALRPGGVALVDVPNMDWLFAGHERYMDFTHEVGFTPESLRQVLGTAFSDVKVWPLDNILELDRPDPGASREARRHGIRTRFSRRLLGTLLMWADGQGASGPIWCRSLLAVARHPTPGSVDGRPDR
jgi:SAM-dependent methyltransferase